jgi:hypothetical protein
MERPSKNGGAASSTDQGKKGNDAVSEYSSKNIIISPFCDHVRQTDLAYSPVTFSDFMDSQGINWHCHRPMKCDHAIVIGGSMVSCRLRTAQLKGEGR